jgi:hypothetical protein
MSDTHHGFIELTTVLVSKRLAKHGIGIKVVSITRKTAFPKASAGKAM